MYSLVENGEKETVYITSSYCDKHQTEPEKFILVGEVAGEFKGKNVLHRAHGLSTEVIVCSSYSEEAEAAAEVVLSTQSNACLDRKRQF